MCKSRLVVLVICVLLILVFASDAISQRTGPAAQALTLKKIKVPASLHRLVSIDDLYLINGKKGIAIAGTGHENYYLSIYGM